MNSAPYYIVICALSLWFYLIFSKIYHKNMIFEKMHQT